MLRFNPFYFYQFGGAVSRLRDLSTSPIFLSSWEWARANTTYNWLLKFADTSQQSIGSLPKSQYQAGMFASDLEPIVKQIGTPRNITIEETAHINAWVQKFEATLEQELQDTFVFVIPQIGAYSMPILINKSSEHLSIETRKLVNPKTLEDFNQAGKALAFDLFTACGFHAMRALETEARHYHMIVTKAATPADVPLGSLINGGKGFIGLAAQWEKEGKLNDSPLGLIVSFLRTITKTYRNPIMHPEMTLDAPQAKEVFDIATIAINQMVADRVRRSAP